MIKKLKNLETKDYLVIGAGLILPFGSLLVSFYFINKLVKRTSNEVNKAQQQSENECENGSYIMNKNLKLLRKMIDAGMYKVPADKLTEKLLKKNPKLSISMEKGVKK